MQLHQYVEIARAANAYTPDLPFLTRAYAYVPVFIYNQFKVGMSEHRHMHKAPLLGYGTTLEGDYEVVVTPDGEPIALHGSKDDEHAGFISGEIFQVPISDLVKLDEEMCNTVHVYRRIVPIRFATSRGNTSSFTAGCWMYEGLKENLLPFLPNFKRAPMLPFEGQRKFLYTVLMDISNKRKARKAL